MNTTIMYSLLTHIMYSLLLTLTVCARLWVQVRPADFCVVHTGFVHDLDTARYSLQSL
jgi:hypothetical protein